MTGDVVELEQTAADVEAELELRDLVRFIPKLTPAYAPPVHLAPFLRHFELAVEGQRQRVLCSAPPRHGKTESVLHVPAFALRRNPELTFAYATYADRLARSKSRKARALALQAGVPLDTEAVNEWRTPQGGGMLAGGVGGPLTGHGVSILVIDDPTKNRLEAESVTYQERLVDWYRDVAATRVEPGGSIFVFATRWTEDDLIGTLAKEGGWSVINLPAISEDGRPLWPERWPVAELEAKRIDVGEYTWASLYQGQPRPRGGRVFNDVHTYRELPRVYQTAFGVDLSYSAKTSSDWSVAVKLLMDASGLCYVTHVERRQCRAPEFRGVCHGLHRQSPSATWRWYAPGPEIGVADLMREGDGVPVVARVPRGDKFVRAQKYAAAWNAGRVLVPEDAPWLDVFLAEHASFTGTGAGHDDQVDAVVAAFDELTERDTGGPKVLEPPAIGFSALRSSRL